MNSIYHLKAWFVYSQRQYTNDKKVHITVICSHVR